MSRRATTDDDVALGLDSRESGGVLVACVDCGEPCAPGCDCGECPADGLCDDCAEADAVRIEEGR